MSKKIPLRFVYKDDNPNVPKRELLGAAKMMLSGRPITKKARQVPTLNLMLQLAPK